MGPARRSLVLSEKEKMNTAYHEAGHALVGRLLPDADPIHKATIIPRGPSLGLTSFLPEEDRHNASKKWCLATIRMSMGGRGAEEVVYNEYTSGCAADLQHATRLARSMVCEWGMSELGPVTFGHNEEVFLGRDFVRSRDISDETASSVDREIHRILEEAYRDAKNMLLTHERLLHALAKALYEKETLESEEIDRIISDNGGGEYLPPRPAGESKSKSRFLSTDQPPAPAETPESPEPGLPPGDIVPNIA
jgi:cell division protease FtsH